VPLITEYHRPERIEEALALLADPRRAVLGGGTVLNADRAPSDIEVVDLQALGLDAIEPAGARLRLGATTTLAALADDDSVPTLVRRLARAEMPSTLRTLATVGGTVAQADPDSVLLAALLAHDAEVEFADDTSIPLMAAMATGVPTGSIILAVTIAVDGDGADASTGRTPADTPIVSAVGRRAADGIRLALTGVGGRPVLADPQAPTADLSPPGDFRGSSVYRLELARILAARVVEELS
jgi:CO/xanthine dehydrogenase FAD-binding subunit